MDTKHVKATVKRYAEDVAAQLKPQQVVLYGSYANGTAVESSDIDIAVIYDGLEGSFLETSSKLWALARKYSSDIEPILLDKQFDQSGFVEAVLTTGQVVYSENTARL